MTLPNISSSRSVKDLNLKVQMHHAKISHEESSWLSFIGIVLFFTIVSAGFILNIINDRKNFDYQESISKQLKSQMDEKKNYIENTMKNLKEFAWKAEESFDTSCSICLGEFEEGEEVVSTPCKHAYHEECLRSWVVQSSQNKNIDIEKSKYSPKCPNCKVSLVKEAEIVENREVNESPI